MRTRTTLFSDFDQELLLKFGSRGCSGTGDFVDRPSDYTRTKVGTRQEKTIVDVEIPNFRALKACNPKQVLPFNPVSIQTTTVIREGAHIERFQKEKNCSRFTGHDYGDYFEAVPVLPLPTIPTSVLDAQVLAACSSARSAIHDTLSDLGELSETVELFITTVKRFANLKKLVLARAKEIARVRSLSKLKKHALDPLASAWLEYRYGWMPIVYSLQDIQKAIEQKERGVVRKRSTTSISLTDSDSYSAPLGWSGDSKLVGTRRIIGTCTVRGYAMASFEKGTGRFGFDPVVTAWELLTMSFVIDWFFSIGSWIQTWSPFSDGRLLISGVSLKWEYTQENRVQAVFGSDSTYDQSGSSGIFSEQVIVTRYERYSYPPPYWPGISVNLNWKRWTDAVALVMRLL